MIPVSIPHADCLYIGYNFNSMNKFISVIIPTFNRRDFLGGAIDSVLKQTHAHFEIIVVDDGSDDGTDDLLAGYGDRIRVIRQEKQGASAARNSGIKAARYDLLAFLDSDDRFVETKLGIQYKAMQENPEFVVSHTDEVWYRRGRLLNQKSKHARTGGMLYDRSLVMCVVGMSTVMARKQLFDAVGLFDESLPCCEDYDLWLRTAIRFPFLKIDAPLTIKNGGRPDQLSHQHRVGMDKFRIRSIHKILAEEKLTAEQRRKAGEELAKKCRIYGRGCLKHGRRNEGMQYLAAAEEIDT